VRLYFIIGWLPFFISTALAAEEFAICKPLTEIAPPRPQLPPSEKGRIRLFADEAVLQEQENISIFSGKVLMQRDEQILSTQLIVYDRDKEQIAADNQFTLWDKQFIVSGQKIKLLPEHRGEMNEASYWLLNRRAWGLADKVIKVNENKIMLENASYSTCDPEKQIWQLQARQVELNEDTEMGTARHVRINLLGIPVFYSPYLSFPLTSARKSGFLPPSLGSSDETGTELSVPYYLNLAPNYDATLTTRMMSRRGLLLNTEFRYLTTQTGGQLEVEYLPHDQAFGKDRSSLSFRHQGILTPRWYTDLNVNYASDSRYFEELGNNINVASLTHLERRGDLYYFGEGWQLLTRLQGFQTLDPSPWAKPYQRLPQLLLSTTLPNRNRALNSQLTAEFTHFTRDTEIITAPVGNRFDVTGLFVYPWRTSGTFLVPKLSLRYTLYDLDKLNDSKLNDTPDRLLFTFSTDSGLFLERDWEWWGKNGIHTLEPRLFYRFTPYRAQENLPVFDTAEYDFSFGQLFRHNRFSGADRIDDAHQISLALTSRLISDETGQEYLRASVGQSYYFRDRRIALPGETEAIELTQGSSPIIMEFSSQLTPHWETAATIRWDSHQDNTEHTVLKTRYHPDREHLLNLSYRLRDSILEQTDISWYWSLGTRWSMLGRWNYSLPDENTLETFAGLEYNSCCWAVRGIARRYLNNVDGSSYLNGFFLQFELKGLTGIGKKADSFLEQRIPGYHDDF